MPRPETSKGRTDFAYPTEVEEQHTNTEKNVSIWGRRPRLQRNTTLFANLSRSTGRRSGPAGVHGKEYTSAQRQSNSQGEKERGTRPRINRRQLLRKKKSEWPRPKRNKQRGDSKKIPSCREAGRKLRKGVASRARGGKKKKHS